MRGGTAKPERKREWPSLETGALILVMILTLGAAVAPADAASSSPSSHQVATCEAAALGHTPLTKADISACAQFPYITFHCPKAPGGRVIRVHSYNIALRLGHEPVRFGNNYTTRQLASTCRDTKAKSSSPLASPSAPKASTAPASKTPPTTTSVPSSFAGTAQPTVTPGTPGKLSVVFMGTPYSPGNIASSGTVLPIAVWNGTIKQVNDLSVSGSASSAGVTVGSGASQDVEPPNLAPGQVAFGVVFFETPVPAGSTFSLSISAAGSFSNTLIVQTTQANSVPDSFGGNAVVGSVTNTNKSIVTGPVSADVFCFANGVLTAIEPGLTSGVSNLNPGATGSYSTDVEDPCPTFLVGASGYT
jgi:hypothetical protein